MQSRFIRYTAVLLVGFFVFGLFSIDADAKQRRKRRSRTVRTAPRPVVTNPDIALPGAEQPGSSTEERVISTADESPGELETTGEPAEPKKKSATKANSSADMQQTIEALSDQVKGLNERLGRMQENDRSLIDMERLTRAEQRAENIRTQQVDVESKLADLQARLEQVEFALKPENIDRATAGYGTTRPEEVRETRKRQLESERSRLQAQIKILETSRQRLEVSVRTADAEVDMLRRRLETRQQQDEAGITRSEPVPTTNPRKPE